MPSRSGDESAAASESAPVWHYSNFDFFTTGGHVECFQCRVPVCPTSQHIHTQTHCTTQDIISLYEPVDAILSALMVRGSKISVHDQIASAVHGNALFSCVLQLDLCVWESVWVPLLPCLHLCTHVHITCSFLKSLYCVYVCAWTHYCTCACVCVCVCVKLGCVCVSRGCGWVWFSIIRRIQPRLTASPAASEKQRASVRPPHQSLCS